MGRASRIVASDDESSGVTGAIGGVGTMGCRCWMFVAGAMGGQSPKKAVGCR